MPLPLFGPKADGVPHGIPVCGGANYDFVAPPVALHAQPKAPVGREVLQGAEVLGGDGGGMGGGSFDDGMSLLGFMFTQRSVEVVRI